MGMTTECKLSVLKKVGNIFNQNKITWAVGASLLLYFKGICDNFNDIDIVIAESDVEKVKWLLADVGALQPQNPHVKYKTKTFLEYKIDHVDLDIMAGFIIVANDKENYFPLQKKDIKDSIELDGIWIPLQAVEEWKGYYLLMDRVDKVELIERKYNR